MDDVIARMAERIRQLSSCNAELHTRRDELLEACKMARERLIGLGYIWSGGPEFDIMHQLDEAIAQAEEEPCQ